MKEGYFGLEQDAPEDRLEMLLDEMLMSDISDNNYPGDSLKSPNWPGYAPGTLGIMNALSGKYCNWTAITNVTPKPPILYVYGAKDNVINDDCVSDVGVLGQKGWIPDYPGEDVYPPQQSATQTRNVLNDYVAAGGTV
jgi:hypothetical protein